MTDGYALLRAIETNPDEDTPRLAYADWLDEHATTDAEYARAEYIRVQCELARGPEPERRSELEARQLDILFTYSADWAADRPLALIGSAYRRGFLTSVAVPAAGFPPHAHRLAELMPLCHLRLDRARDALGAVAACPQLALVRRLAITGSELQNADAAALARSPHLGNLQHLDLTRNEIGAHGATALATARVPALRGLRLSQNPIKDRGLAAVRAAEWFPRLESLHLGECAVSDAALIALTADPNAAGLRTLALYDVERSGAVARAILDSPHLAKLQRLCFPEYQSSDAVRAALRARFSAHFNTTEDLFEGTVKGFTSLGPGCLIV